MPERKIIQITTAEGYYSRNTYALCDDGTVWRLELGGMHYNWKQMPPIPQEEEDARMATDAPTRDV